MSLTEQGRILLENGKPDDAIRALERSIHLDPTNGQNYYYLSEVWLLKGDMNQAKEFNYLAGLYLKENTEWSDRLKRQRERIERGGKAE